MKLLSAEETKAAPRWVFLLLGGSLLVQLFVLYVWSAAGQIVSIEKSPGAGNGLSVIGMASVGLWLSWIVLWSFPRGAPLRSAWLLLVAAAAADVIPGLLAQFRIDLWAAIAAGPFRLILVAASIFPLLRVLRRFGFSARPSAASWAIPGIFCLFAVGRFVEIAGLRTARPAGLEEFASLAQLLILCVLFFQAMMLRATIRQMGTGCIARPWIALIYAIFLSGAGEIVLWALPHYWHAPLPVLTSLVRLPITAAFALIPACQLAAQRRSAKTPSREPESFSPTIPQLAR